MSLVFYPQVIEGASLGTIDEQIELLLEGAQRYKAVILDTSAKEGQVKAINAPKDVAVSYNWDLVAAVLREVREMPEGKREDRTTKADRLMKLAEIYEILRSAKMARLEAVRLALTSEAGHLRGGSSASTQVA